MRCTKILLIAGMAAALAACSSGIVVNEPVFEQLYVDGDLEYAAQSGELRTEVYGNPYGMGGARFTSTVTGLMKGANLGREVTFTASPKGPGSGPYHAVMVFNAATGTSPHEVCSAPAKIPTGPRGTALTLLSGFCIGDTLLSTADGTTFGVAATEDPRFRELVRGVTLALFPAYDHHDVGGDSVTN